MSTIGESKIENDNPYYSRNSKKLLLILREYMPLAEIEQKKTMFGMLLRKFVGNTHLPLDLFSMCINDIQVYDILHKLTHERGIDRVTLASSASTAIYRANQRSSEICDVFESLGISIEGGRYLDYGCSTGTITAAVGRRLGANTHGCDVPLWHGIENKCSDKFVTYRHLDNGKVPDVKDFKNFNLVTVFMVLHHVPKNQLAATIQNIVDLIITDGYLLIREHDVISPETHDYCHFEHAMYDLVTPSLPFNAFYDEYEAHYYSMDNWEQLICGAGMEILYTTKPWGSTRYTYMLFKKSKKIEPVSPLTSNIGNNTIIDNNTIKSINTSHE